ncbi:MAG: AAA family ATPase [Nanoarchaeota archaeon]|nr:AAA family ATPase [Nanoarchaeota archaeon]
MIITISGTPGSGKSTIAKILVEKLQAQRIYVGGIRRELAKEKGMTLMELNDYAQTHPEMDVDVDEKAAAQARKLGQGKKVVVVEGRTQYHFLPESIKLFVTVSVDEAARRIWKDLQQQDLQQQRNEGSIHSLAEMKKSIMERFENDQQRFKKYYNLDITDTKQYDLVIDTTKITAEQGAQKILSFLEHKKLINKS